MHKYIYIYIGVCMCVYMMMYVVLCNIYRIFYFAIWDLAQTVSLLRLGELDLMCGGLKYGKYL